ncbi:MAG: hypothetical protein K6F22_01600 [Prevotella sp.]|nr:hypothetical protein [Prevotella sp.]
MEERFNINEVRVLRTKEGTAFEVVTIGTLIAAWIVAIMYHRLDETNEIISIIVVSVATLWLLFEVYWPSQISITGVKLRNIRQVALAVRWCRVIALQIAILQLGFAILGYDSPFIKLWAIGMAVFVVVVAFVFIYFIQKAG